MKLWQSRMGEDGIGGDFRLTVEQNLAAAAICLGAPAGHVLDSPAAPPPSSRKQPAWRILSSNMRRPRMQQLPLTKSMQCSRLWSLEQ